MTRTRPTPDELRASIPQLPVAARATGCYIYDETGKDYLDGSAGPVAANIGHGVPEVVRAITEQAARLPFVYRTQFTCRPLLQLTEAVRALAEPWCREVVYTNSGSEATETALRLTFHHHATTGGPQRRVVLTQRPGYHGMTAGALGISGHPARREHLAALHNHSAATVPVVAHDPERLLPELTDWTRAVEQVGADRVAAVVVEPVGGAASGAAVVDDETLRGVAELCRRSGALLIADEVMTGFGRTGAWFGFDHAGVQPDLVVTGKGLSAGYTPIGACLVGAGVLPRHSAADLAFGHTMSGNPLSAATALAVLAYTREHRLPERAREVGARLRAELNAVAERVDFLGEVRGRGLLLAVPVHQEQADHVEAPLATRICMQAQQHGLIVYPAGIDYRSQAVLVAPPLTVSDDELAVLLHRLTRTTDAVARELGSGR